MSAYHRLAPPTVSLNDAGRRLYVDPSADWPIRRAVSVPHVQGNRTRNAPSQAAVAKALELRAELDMQA